MSQKVWRNSEGREFPVYKDWECVNDESGLVQPFASIGGAFCDPKMMCKLGYELVDASEEPPQIKWKRMFAGIYDKAMAEKKSATQVGSWPVGTSLEDVIREAKREAYYEGLERGIRLPAAFLPSGIDVRDYYKTPYDPEPPKGESEEFEVVCHGSIGGYKDEEDCGVPVMKQTLGVVHHPRLIPGKTYVVRLKGEK